MWARPWQREYIAEAPIGACVEVANLEAIRAKEAIGDLRRCHVVDIDVMDGRLLVITWDWGK